MSMLPQAWPLAISPISFGQRVRTMSPVEGSCSVDPSSIDSTSIPIAVPP